jgi:hypothetical protein
LIARLSLNAIRHPMDKLDFDELAACLVKEGVKYGNIAKEISNLTGVTYETVLRNLDSGFKKPSNVHFSKEMKHAIGKRMSEAAAEKRMHAEDESVENIESMTDGVESRVGEAVKAYGNETAQAYDALSVGEPIGEAKSENVAVYHSFLSKISALSNACDFITNMQQHQISEYYQSLGSGERSAVDAKLQYLTENVEKLKTSCTLRRD